MCPSWAQTELRENLEVGNPLKNMVGRDGIEPPTPGFSVLSLKRRHRSPSRLVAISKGRGRCSALLRPIASCYAAWVTISVTDASARSEPMFAGRPGRVVGPTAGGDR